MCSLYAFPQDLHIYTSSYLAFKTWIDSGKSFKYIQLKYDYGQDLGLSGESGH